MKLKKDEVVNIFIKNTDRTFTLHITVLIFYRFANSNGWLKTKIYRKTLARSELLKF